MAESLSDFINMLEFRNHILYNKFLGFKEGGRIWPDVVISRMIRK